MQKNNDRKNVAKHILPTSANLLGLCFVLLGFIKISKLSDATIIDECLGVVIVFFLFSSIFSYASMRSSRHSEIYEKVADILFLIGLSCLTLISLVIVFQTA